MKKKRAKKRPVVLISCNLIQDHGVNCHNVYESFILAVTDVVGATPFLLPALGKRLDYHDIVKHVDGIFLTGARSHVDPKLYGAEQTFEDRHLDLARDATTFPLISEALKLDMPLMTICRGFQELNVHTGGSLHQRIHEMPGKNDHRFDPAVPLAASYERRAHKMLTQTGGVFERLGLPREFEVNSLHQQGVDRLGKGLHVEAISDDGIVEAVSIPNKTFVLGVQWHPEGDWQTCPASKKILKSFGDILSGS